MSLLQRLKSAVSAQQPAVAVPDTELATAVLLYEIARADMAVGEAERDTLAHLLSTLPGVDEATASELLDRAAEVVDREVSLHDYIDALNARLDPEQRRRMIRMIWQVAWADGVIEPQEEHMTRRLADLLFVPHSVFIQEKLNAEEIARAGADSRR